jgi:flagellar biosynthesis GTPase FlhF
MCNRTPVTKVHKNNPLFLTFSYLQFNRSNCNISNIIAKHTSEVKIVKKSKISIVLMSVLFIPTLVLGNGSKVNACSKLNPFCREEKILQMPPSPAQIDAKIKAEAQQQADAVLAEKRAKRKAEDDAINKANAETLARQQAEEMAAKESADNIKRQEEEEKLANQQRDEKERNETKNNTLIKAGVDLFNAIFNKK